MRDKEDEKRSKIELFPQLKVEDIKEEDKFLFHKLMEEADQYEKKLNADPSLDNIEEQPQIFSSIVEELIRLNKWQDGFGDDSMDGSEVSSEVISVKFHGNKHEKPDAGSDTESGNDSDGGLENEFSTEFGAEYATELADKSVVDYAAKSSAIPETAEKEKQDKAANAYNWLSDEDRKAFEIGKKKLAMRKRDRLVKILGTAAVVVFCFCAVGLSSDANREKIMNIWRTITEDGLRIQITSNTSNLVSVEESAENRAISEIKSKLEILAPQMMYRPMGMKFIDYNIDIYGKVAFMQYEYKETILNISMYQKDYNIERSVIFDGEVVDQFTTKIASTQTVDIFEINNPNNEKLYVSEFTFDENYYTISGILSKKEFTKMLNNITF